MTDRDIREREAHIMADGKNKGNAGEFGEVARGIAPTAIGMAVFALFYSIWFGLAWG